MNKKINKIKYLVKNYTIETTPKVFKKTNNLNNFINPDTHIYITYLPDENPENIIETAKKIKQNGFEPIPHLPARTMKNYSELEKYLGKLSEESGVKKILIIGGNSNQKGDISSSMQVLKTRLTEKYNYKEIGLAGHPEGNPDISNKELDYAIIEKNKFAKDTDAKLYFVTQFFFEVESFINWEKHLTKLKNEIKIHAGLPGPANLKTLISYAKSCGIGNSIKLLTKQALNITKITSTKAPNKLIYDLASYKMLNHYSNLEKLHFYPFGGLKKTSSWANALINNELSLNEKNDIDISDFKI